MKAIADCTGSRFSSQSKEPDHVISRRLLGDCTIPAVQYSRYEKGGRGGGLMMNVNELMINVNGQKTKQNNGRLTELIPVIRSQN